MSGNGGRTGTAWDRARRAVLATQTHCSICGKPVDKLARYRFPNGDVNPASPSVDHIKPLAKGGRMVDLSNLSLVHLGCNSRKGARQHTPRSTSRRL